MKRKRTPSRPITSKSSSSRTRESLALLGLLWAVGQSNAQETAAPASESTDAEGGTLPPQVVEAAKPAPKPRPVPGPQPVIEEAPEPEPLVLNDSIYKPTQLTSTKYTQPLLDIPQTVQIIPETLMRDQGATSLREALRSVSGISLAAGEGGGGAPGDNLTLRGFGARNDFFVDGIRDFGSYYRDPFNLEQIEVVKGPSSANSGRGATGGYLNLGTKKARIDDNFTRVDTSVGSDSLLRGTVDYNQEIEGMEGAAFRVNLLAHDQDVPGRDFVFNKRYGVNTSLGFGLQEGSDSRLFIDMFYQEEDNLSDYGIPFVPNTVTNPALTPYIYRPAPVDFDNYYGVPGRDFEENDVARFTVSYEHDFNESVTFRNQTRVGETNRHNIATAPRFVGGASLNVNRQFQERDESVQMFVNQSDVLFEFDTFGLSHEAIAGFEVSSENYRRDRMAPTAQANQTDIFNPNAFDGSSTSYFYDGRFSDTESLTTAVYLFDTVEVTKWLDITGGARFDRVDLDFQTRAAVAGPITGANRVDDIASGRAAAVFKPAENGSVYLGWGTSFNQAVDTVLLGGNLTDVAPEMNETVELGTKWDLMDERLSLSAALFRIDKTNARSLDTVTNETTLDGSQRVDGFEFGAAGEIAPWLNMVLSYTHLDATLTGATANASAAELANVGNDLANTPEDSFSLWFQAELPNNFFVGGGPVYVADRFSSTANTNLAPSYLIWDALVGYRVNEKLTLRMNLNNITDENYVGTVGGGHFIPGEGRSVMFSASMEF